MLSAKTCGQHNKVIDSVSTIRLIALISVVLSFLVGRGSLLIQCQDFEILFIPFISASILIICCAYINYVQSYAIICKIYPFCPFFFHFCSIFRQKRRPSSRFLPFQAVCFETICTSPAYAKVAQLLSRRPATLAQICRRHPPSFLPIVFHFFAAPSVFSATSSILPLPPFSFSAAPAVLLAILTFLSATAPILPATTYMLISGHEIMIAKHDFLISCPETTISRLAIILKRAAGTMALVSAQGVAYASD